SRYLSYILCPVCSLSHVHICFIAYIDCSHPRLCFFFFLMVRPPPTSTLFPYTTLFRSYRARPARRNGRAECRLPRRSQSRRGSRSEEHTSELQSPYDLVCRLLLEKKKKQIQYSRLTVLIEGFVLCLHRLSLRLCACHDV